MPGAADWEAGQEVDVSTPSIRHQEIVSKVLENKAVDFEAIGRMVGELGPTMASTYEPWEGFCGTMRNFVRVYRLSGVGVGGPVEDLGQLAASTKELQ